MTSSISEEDYRRRVAAESRKWGDHLIVEASGEWNAWLDHPLISAHYKQRSLIEGLPWEHWVRKELNGPAQRSLDLGCGAGTRSLAVFNAGSSRWLDGFDVSADRIAEAEKMRKQSGAPGSFRVVDINSVELPAETYDLIFSAHSFHHFIELEHIMEQVHKSLTSRGLFILEEYVGPTQLQWTEEQMELVRSLLSLIPERLRWYRNGVLKNEEGRPTPDEVIAVSPFESIRSAEIAPLFQEHFEMVTLKPLGGTIQHLLYNGIVHNFDPQDDEAVSCLQTALRIEDALIDGCLVPSDFALLVGRREDAVAKLPDDGREVLQRQAFEMESRVRLLAAQVAENERAMLTLRAEVKKSDQRADELSHQLSAKEAEIQRMTGTLGWRLLSLFGPIKYGIVLPLFRLLGLMPESTGMSEGPRTVKARDSE